MLIFGRCASSTSVSWAPMVNTGLSAFIALCITTEICDQRTTRELGLVRGQQVGHLPGRGVEPHVTRR